MSKNLVDEVAHLITGAVRSSCCYKSGGYENKYTHPNCECRETAKNIIDFLSSKQWKTIESVPKDGRTVIDLWFEGVRYTDMIWSITSPANPNGSWKKKGDDWQNELSWLNPTHWAHVTIPSE